MLQTYTSLLKSVNSFPPWCTSVGVEHMDVERTAKSVKTSSREKNKAANNNIISRIQAACFFYRKAYNVKNAKECLEKINRMEEADICFTTNPYKPIVVSEATIYGEVDVYHQYQLEKDLQKEEEEEEEEEEVVTFETKAQVKEFLNAVVQNTSQANLNHRYVKQALSTTAIFNTVKEFTTLYKTKASFATWCSKAKVDFLRAPCTKKERNVRSLFVLKKKYHGDLAKRIGGTLATH